MVWGLLARGHWRARRRRYVALAVVFAICLASFFGLLLVVGGARDALVDPLRATLTGPLRVSNETTDVGGGTAWTDYRPVAAQIQRRVGGIVVPRFESNFLTLREETLANWSAGLLVGVEWARDPLVADLRPYLVWGTPIESDFVYAPDGEGFRPIVVGAEAAKRLNLSLDATGPDFGRPLLVTSGHAVGNNTLPINVDVVVVGVFETGLDPLDKFLAFAPIATARYLAGLSDADPVANALLVQTEDSDAAADAIRDMGYEAETVEEFAFGYMGAMLVVLYGAAFVGLGLFLGALLVWLMHQTSGFIRADQPVLSSLRAVGISSRRLIASYAALATGAAGAGAAVALALAFLVVVVRPRLEWKLSGLSAQVVPTAPAWLLVVLALGAVAAAALAAYLAARRIGRLNILDGLRSN